MASDLSFANTISQPCYENLLKEVTTIEGVPHIKWTKKDVHIMDRTEELQLAVIEILSME